MDANDFTGGLGAIFLIIAVPLLYMLPFIVALCRKCKATAAIIIVNIFLGWTFIGWVVALAWAASGATEPRLQPQPLQGPGL
jgi:Superinfection immunity protein